MTGPAAVCVECGGLIAAELVDVGATTHIMCGTDAQRREAARRLWGRCSCTWKRGHVAGLDVQCPRHGWQSPRNAQQELF